MTTLYPSCETEYASARWGKVISDAGIKME
jgi:hypothetical protein